MAIFRCKMCGGEFEIEDGKSVGTCEYCGTEQTIPRLDSEIKANLYDRANHFRRNNDFDKAMEIYEQILNIDDTDAEAYWSLILCGYGIEYVEDPASHRRLPTVNRTQYTSIYADENYKSALEYALPAQRSIYEQEAKVIDNIQKDFLTISSKEKPFDVFICYKESDGEGKRTPDSVLANDIYDQLTQEGFKVFFARITLEDKLGHEYEPHIFAALNSAKAMVVVGTKPEHFKAAWVKNEWSRFLALIGHGERKILIPAYKDMDPYDLPEEFSHLQAQDMTKIGFMQDLIRAIRKIMSDDQPAKVIKETISFQGFGGIGKPEALLERGYLAIEDKEWDNAYEYFEKVLIQEPEWAEAYLGKLMAKYMKSDLQSLTQYYLSKYEHTSKIRYACEEDIAHIREAVSNYTISIFLPRHIIEQQYNFDRSYLSLYENKVEKKEKLLNDLANEELLLKAQEYATGETQVLIDDMLNEISASLDEHIEAAKQSDNEEIESIRKKYKRHINDADKYVRRLYKTAWIKRTLLISGFTILFTLYIFYVLIFKIIIPTNNANKSYNQAVELMNDGHYKEAIELFEALDGYKDSEEQIANCNNELK